ncbi:MAG: acyltransferase family protein [Ignavibacteria bacterium]|jgi:peptidoglycan/LPS O-acetylase OafA/YrhL
MTNIPALTGIRALAAGAVFFGHVFQQHHQDVLPIFKYGWMGVNVFFALSGYLFYHLYADSIEDHTFSWKRYLSKRFIRIYPLTILITVLTVVISPSAFNLFDILTHLTLLHGFIPDYRLSVNTPMWTLTVELCFYLIAPILITYVTALYREKRNNLQSAGTFSANTNIALFALALWVLIVASCNGFTQFYQNITYFFTGLWDKGAGTLTIFGRLDDFVAGMLVAGYGRSIIKGFVKGDLLVLLGAIIIGSALTFTEMQGGSDLVGRHKLSDFVYPSLALGSSIIFLGLHRGGFIANILSSRFMVLLGNISFGLYLIHFITLPGFAQAALETQVYLESMGLGITFSGILNYVCYSILAYATYLFYEKPVGLFLSKRMLSK